MPSCKTALAVFLGLALFCFSLTAQEATGKVAGNVTDPSGAAVANAKVTVIQVATGTGHQTQTDQSGFYQVLQLPIGQYRVTAEAARV